MNQSEFLQEKLRPFVFQSPKCKDDIHIVIFKTGGGLLSYHKPDETFVHTLNTPEGMKRKTTQLEIELLINSNQELEDQLLNSALSNRN